jgi:hypothetical protein
LKFRFQKGLVGRELPQHPVFREYSNDAANRTASFDDENGPHDKNGPGSRDQIQANLISELRRG